ncbi:MAG: arsenate reductase (glutaredoxin) [Flavobacteriales bacterium]|nr:arsenate reductase (glutaredoxin) [Flavobacteriales bacterium]
MKFTIWHNPRCSKSRETLEVLRSHGIEPEIRLYLTEPPVSSELKEIIDKLEIEPHELIRKGEEIYKKNYKNKEMKPSDWIDVMAENPVLIERPIVIKGNKARIGRPPDNVLDLI